MFISIYKYKKKFLISTYNEYIKKENKSEFLLYSIHNRLNNFYLTTIIDKNKIAKQKLTKQISKIVLAHVIEDSQLKIVIKPKYLIEPLNKKPIEIVLNFISGKQFKTIKIKHKD